MAQYKRILAVLDPADAPSPAARRAAYLSRASGTDLHCVVFAHDRAIAAVGLARPDVMAPARRAFLDEKRQQLRCMATAADFAGVRLHLDVVWHLDAAAAICERARDMSADLVVLDVRHDPLLLRLLLKPLDWQLLRSCPVPLLLVNGKASLRPVRVIAAVDTSDPGAIALNETVVKAALDLSPQCEAVLELAHAFEEMPGIAITRTELDPEILAQAEEERRADGDACFRAFADRHGVSADRRRLLRGVPARALADLAGNEGADVLVLGVGRHIRLKRLLMGSTAEEVLHLARCDILAVRSAA